MPTTPTSLLQATNLLLSTIGDSPVNSITGSLTAEISTALNVLSEVTRAVQLAGHPFNTEYLYTLSLDDSSEIPLPSNAVRVKIAQGKYSGVDPVIRGQRLYDRTGHTFEFTQAIECDEIVFLLDFDELPESVRQYVTVRSARIFQDRVQGSDSSHVYTLQDEAQAKRQMLADIGSSSSLSFLQDPMSLQAISR